MEKSNTSGQEPDRHEVPNQEIEFEIENPIQAEGYVRLYRAVRDSVGFEPADLYGVLEDYYQLSRRNRRPCMPTQAELAKHMGVSDRQVRTHLKTLETKGWIGTKQIGRNRTLYTIKTGSPLPHRPEVGFHTDRKSASGLIKQEQRASQNKQVKENPKEKSGTQHLENKELAHAYWTDPILGNHRLGAFKLVFEIYPRSDQEQTAMAAWRHVIGEKMDKPVTPAMDKFFNAICAGANWYAELCKREKRETKYITAFPKWIREELWNDAPEHIRYPKDVA